MEPTDTPAQVETAQESTPAPAPETTPVSQVATPTSSTPTDAELDAEFAAAYEPKSEASESVEQTQEEEPAPEAETPVAEAEQPTEPTPEEQAKAAELEEQNKGRFRLKGADAIIAAIAKEENCTIAEASDRYRGIARTAPSPIPGLDETSQPSSATAELQSQVDALAGEIEEAEKGEDYLNPDHFKKVRQLAGLEADLKLARFQEGLEKQGKAKDADTAIVAERNKNIVALQTEYPSLLVKGSPMAKASEAVITEWQNSPDPSIRARLEGPAAPGRVVNQARERVANDLVSAGKFRTLDLAIASLKTAPVAPTAKPPLPVSAPAPALQPRRVTPPSGSRTQTNGAAKPSSFGSAVAAADTPEEADRLFEEAYGSGTPQPLGRR